MLPKIGTRGARRERDFYKVQQETFERRQFQLLVIMKESYSGETYS